MKRENENNNNLPDQPKKYLKFEDALTYVKKLKTLFGSKNPNLDIVKNLVNEMSYDTINIIFHELNPNLPSLLQYVAASGASSVLKYLIEEAGVRDSPSLNGDSAIHFAASAGNLECLQYLYEKDNNQINRLNNLGHTPFIYALSKGQTSIIIYLLSKDIDLNFNIVSYLGFQTFPLHIVAQEGHVEVVKLLLEKGANIEAINNQGFTPLWIAAYKGHTEIVKVLIAAGADKETKTEDEAKSTPLLIAVQEGHTEIVKVLIAAGVDIGAINNQGFTPLLIAAYKGHTE